MGEVKILLVDDHEVVRIGLSSLLEREAGFRVVGEAASAAEALDKALRLRPDVIVMDIRLDGTSGVEACREILQKCPNTRVIMLTAYADDEAVMGSILAGASGYVLKQVGSRALVEAIKAVARGESLLDPAVTGAVLARVRNGTGYIPEQASLTQHEKRILDLICEGKTNKEIAQTLYLSEKTIRNYVSRLLRKLKSQNRTEAAARTLKAKLLGGN